MCSKLSYDSNDDKPRLVSLLLAVNSAYAVLKSAKSENPAKSFASSAFVKNGQMLDLPEPEPKSHHPQLLGRSTLQKCVLL